MAKGLYYDANGYVRLKVNGKLVFQHRVIIEKSILRKLKPNEVVHHRNGKKDDNRLQNLEVMTWSDHSKEHVQERGGRVTLKCSFCSKSFSRRKSRLKYTKKLGQNKVFCSRACGFADKRDGKPFSAHGTVAAYMRCGPPTCESCRLAMREYGRLRRAKSKIK